MIHGSVFAGNSRKFGSSLREYLMYRMLLLACALLFLISVPSDSAGAETYSYVSLNPLGLIQMIQGTSMWQTPKTIASRSFLMAERI